MTVAFEIKSPFKRKSKLFPKGYRKTLVTIWHVDPESDGTDDSCGWFMRSRHGDRATLERIIKRFEFDFDRVWKSDSGQVYNCGLFLPNGLPHFSVPSIAINLFYIAACEHFDCDGGTNWKKARKWMQKNLFDILHFAENPTDSLHDGFTRKFEIGCNEKYTQRNRDERIRNLASCIYSWILRSERPWYRHPRWHFWHWKIQVHGVLKFKRWAFSRCCKCGRRFKYGESPVSDQWDNDGPRWFSSERGIYHQSCHEKSVCQTDSQITQCPSA